MDLLAIEQRLRGAADVHLVDSRLLRHVIKQHRHISGVVPHHRCYALPRIELERLSLEEGSLQRPESGRKWVILLHKPTERELKRRAPADLQMGLLRAALHARIHVELEEKVRRGELSEADVQHRIEAIGRTEFAEIRSTLAHDDLLLPPASDLEAYIEFAATYLELRRFAPALIAASFPGLSEDEHLDDVLSADVDAEALPFFDENDRSVGFRGPISRTLPLSQSRHTASSRAGPRNPTLPLPRPVSPRGHARLMRRAEHAARQGHHAQAAVWSARAARVTQPRAAAEAEQTLGRCARALAARLHTALQGLDSSYAQDRESWSAVLLELARHAAAKDRPKSSPEYGLLVSVQRAAASYEHPGILVDVPGWILSGGERPIVRSRHETRRLQVARVLRQVAHSQVHRVEPRAFDRVALLEHVQTAERRADENARSELRPRIRRELMASGFSPLSGPEQHALQKLVEELLDIVLDRGFLSLPQLRDAVSRNEAKLEDLSGTAELWRGDALLLADSKLEVALDGVYRRGDVYLRVLQKASSIPFGTTVGRILTLNLVLPALGSFTLLEGSRLILDHVLGLLGHEAIAQPTTAMLLGVALAIVALIHSPALRVFARQLLDVLGIVLAWVFFRIPRAVLLGPLTQRLLGLAWVRGLLRRMVVPGALAFGVWLAEPTAPKLPRMLLGATVFVVLSTVMGSRIGWRIEDYIVEQLAPTWHVFSRQWLPELVRAIGRTFAHIMEAFERGLYRVQSALRFPSRSSSVRIGVSAALGTVVAAVAYFIRLYVTLLVEPELNPLKHFPVVTVMHKLTLPFLPELLFWVEKPLLLLGPIVGGALAGLTVFLLPSLSGFLLWELKANYRLYRATRSEHVRPAQLGPHGETMQRLLVAGLHSGTLPKLYRRLRRAAQRHHERSSSRTPSPSLRRGVGGERDGLAEFRRGIRGVQRGLRRFAERELLAVLNATDRWRISGLTLDRVDLSSNRVRIRFSCESRRQDPCELTMEQLGDRIVASISIPGFLARLDDEHRILFENALAVFYQRAQVQLVREQLEAELGSRAHYDIADEGLVVWPEPGYELEVVYRLGAYRPKALKPKPFSRATSLVLDSRRVLFSHQQISWSAWEAIWRAYENPTEPVRRLLLGPSLLPPGPATAAHIAHGA